MNRFFRRAVAPFVALVCFALAQDAQNVFVPEQKKLLAASFEEVWTTVRDKHYDPTLGGLDWQKVYGEFKPRIDATESMEAGRTIMNEMLGRLKQTHIGVIPSSTYRDLSEGGERGASGAYTPGIDVRILEGKAIVTHVEPNSPASVAGVKPGWEIIKVNGREAAQGIKRVEDLYSKSTQKDLMGSRVILNIINGTPSQAAEIEFHDGRVIKAIKLDRVEPRGSKIKYGEMPPSYFWVETNSREDGIRVIKFNIWLNPEAVAKAFSEIIADAGKAKGFIIDLRGNPGGLGAMAMGAAGWFTSQRGLKLGTMAMRGNTLNFVVFPRPNATSAPVAILVDGCSASTSEIFASGMQDLKRARIFGTRTAGAALPSTFTRLPNGDGFQYIVANYISIGGKPLEGLGVEPDETVRLTQHGLLAGKDEVMDRAVEWIGLGKSDK
jgi:carboxyl-terminal processing protease